jgi:hypothetical protein
MTPSLLGIPLIRLMTTASYEKSIDGAPEIGRKRLTLVGDTVLDLVDSRNWKRSLF